MNREVKASPIEFCFDLKFMGLSNCMFSEDFL